jgi:hypothetical protein
LLTSQEPDRHAVQHHAPHTDTPTSVLTCEDVMKFSIGLRLLGEQKKRRFLAYIATLTNEGHERQEGKP